jgi:hypothetical protein
MAEEFNALKKPREEHDYKIRRALNGAFDKAKESVRECVVAVCGDGRRG